MLVIDKTQLLTVEDFMKNKGHSPFNKWRTISKTVNFSLLFGCSAGRFATVLRNNGFSISDCDEYIQLMGLQQTYNAALAKQMNSKKKMTPEDVKFLVVADSMRTNFFATYVGLDSRIKREQAFALANGYVRSWHGPIRHLAELRYMQHTKDGNLSGADKFLYSKAFAHLLNNACNSTIQSMEARIAFATWTNIARYLSLWGLKSYAWNNVHDSIDFYIYKPELEVVLALANEAAAFERPPVKGIHMKFDAEVSDLSDMEHRNNTFYKHGEELDIIPLDEALKHYNEKHGTDLKYFGCDWLYDYGHEDKQKLYDSFAVKYGKEATDNFIKAWNSDDYVRTPSRRIVNA